ncbi:hypothetical protein D3C80_763700 [compost metagenome]
MPPPTPVSMPSRTAITGLRPNASAFSAPATAKKARPMASSRRTGVCSLSISGHQKKVIRPAAKETVR